MWKALSIKPRLLIFLIAVMSVIFTAKVVGWVQSGEWIILDLFFQLRPQEPIDKRIIIVNLTENDIKNLDQGQVSDRNLAKLLNKIKQQNPVAIGLDVIRDKPVGSGYEELVKVFKTTPSLIGIESVLVKGSLNEKILPPPVLKELEQVSTVDTLIDGDRKVRRSLLYPLAEGSEDLSNLGLALAFKYLEKHGVDQGSDPNGFLRLGKTTILPLKENDGGYSNTDAGGYQILTNYRGPSRSFVTVTFTDVLADIVPSNLMTNRIVLIGVSAKSSKDFFFTPYSKNLQTTPDLMAGVEINASITSQVIASVLDNRPLFQFLPEIIEDLGILLLITGTIVLIWVIKPNDYKDFSTVFLWKLIVLIMVLAAGITGLSYLAFLNMFWLPTFLPLLCLICSSLSITGYIYLEGIKTANVLLERKNKLLYIKQVELENYSYSLKEKSLALKESEANLIFALDAAHTGIFHWDLIKDEINILHNCIYLLGEDTDSITTSPEDFFDWVHETDLPPLMTFINELIEDARECNFEFRVSWKTGSLHWLLLKGKICYDLSTVQPIKIIGTLSNITKRKENENSFAEKDEIQKALGERSFDVSMLLEEDLAIRFFSRSSRRILGYNPSEVYGINFTNFVHPQDLDSLFSSIRQVVTKHASITQVEYRWLHKNGSWRILESVICNQLQDPLLMALVVNSRDITEYQ